MAYRITPPHDPAIQIEFELPIKGRKPLPFQVPKLHYLSKAHMDEYDTWCKTDEARQYAGNGAEAAGTRKLLEILQPKHIEIWANLTVGELLDISQYWRKQSELTIPESEASDAS